MEITRVPHTVPATACLHSITTHNRDIRGISYEIMYSPDFRGDYSILVQQPSKVPIFGFRGAFCKNSKVRGAILARIPNSGEHTFLDRIPNSGEHTLFVHCLSNTTSMHDRNLYSPAVTELQSTTKAPYHYPEKFPLPPGPYTQFLENTQSQIVPSMTLSPFQYVPAAVAYYDSTDWVESIMHVLPTTASSDLDPLMPKHASPSHFQDLVLVQFFYVSIFLYS
jgi:hypothetical protein